MSRDERGPLDVAVVTLARVLVIAFLLGVLILKALYTLRVLGGVYIRKSSSYIWSPCD